MNRTLNALAAAALLCAVPAAAEEVPAGDKMTLEKVLDGYYKAIGGLDAWAAVTSARITGKMSAPNGLEAPFTLTFKSPGKSRLEFTIQGLTGVQAVDGKSAWQIMPFMGKTGAEPMPPDQARLMIEQADFDGPLVNWQEDGNQLEYLGTELFEGTDAHKIQVTLPNGEVRTYFLDAVSFLPVKATGKTTVQGQEISFQTTMNDYRPVEGLVLPYRVESRAVGSAGGQVFTIDTTELNVELADEDFSMPRAGG